MDKKNTDIIYYPYTHIHQNNGVEIVRTYNYVFCVCHRLCVCVCVCMDQFHFSFVTRSLKSCTVKREQERKFFFRFWWCHFFTRREMWWKKIRVEVKFYLSWWPTIQDSGFEFRIIIYHCEIDWIRSFHFGFFIYIFLAWNSVCFLKNISQFGYHSYKFEFSVLNLGNIFYFFFVSNHFSKKKKKNDLKIGKKFGKNHQCCVWVCSQ